MNEQNKIIRINWQKVVFVHLYNGAELNDWMNEWKKKQETPAATNRQKKS